MLCIYKIFDKIVKDGQYLFINCSQYTVRAVHFYYFDSQLVIDYCVN